MESRELPRSGVLEDLIDGFMHLTYDTADTGSLADAISMQEQLSVVLELFSREAPDRWAPTYLTYLEELVFTYMGDGQLGNAVRTAEKQLNTVTPLYRSCQREWARQYAQSMFLLAALYDVHHLSTRFRELRVEGLSVIHQSDDEGDDWPDGEELWFQYRSRVASRFTDGRPTDTTQSIVQKLENDVASRWNDFQTGKDSASPELHELLRDSSIAYTRIGRIPGAIALERMQAVVLSELHRSNPAAWVRRKIECQYRQAILYHMADHPESAQTATREGLHLVHENQQLSDYHEMRARFLSTLGFVFLTKKEPEKAIGPLSEALAILRREVTGSER